MIRATRIRLWLDLCIQLILFILLIIQIVSEPKAGAILYHISLFGILLSSWQILHAFYVVKKYKDWQRTQYLYNIRQVLGYGLLTFGIALFILISSFGFMAPFFFFTLKILHWLLSSIVLLLAANYFIISTKRLYEFLYKPKSFWDL
jgi:hypothetical protein